MAATNNCDLSHNSVNLHHIGCVAVNLFRPPWIVHIQGPITSWQQTITSLHVHVKFLVVLLLPNATLTF